MEQEPESFIILIGALNNASSMTEINVHIDDSPYDFDYLKKLLDLNASTAAKLRMQSFEEYKGALDHIYEILFDKTIFSHLHQQKVKKSDYAFLFYFFFKHDYFNTFFQQLNYKNTEKFFKKFFNSCINSENNGTFFTNEELAEFINFYISELL